MTNFALYPATSTKSLITEPTKSITTLNTRETVPNDSTMEPKPVDNVDVSNGDNVSLVSIYGDDEMCCPEEIPKRDSKSLYASNCSSTKRKPEVSQSTSNKT